MPNRYWIGGGTNSNWNASPTTNWASSSGDTVRVAAPTAVDSVFFDGVGTNANTNSIISATAAINSLTVTSGYSATMSFNAALSISSSLTFGANMGISGSSNITFVSSSTITSNGKVFTGGILVSPSGQTITLNDNLTISGSFGSTANSYTLNGNNLYVRGGFQANNTGIGTTVVNLIGTGTVQSVNANNNIQNSIVINTSGTITIGTLAFSNASFTYTAGTVTHTGTIAIGPGTTFNTAGMTFNTASSATATITLNSQFSCGVFNSTAAGLTFAGTGGFNIGTYNWTTSATTNTLTLTAGNTYIITNTFTSPSWGAGAGFRATVQSSDAILRANLTLSGSATANTSHNFTRINASGGNPIFTWNGTVTDSPNVISFSDKRTVGRST